MILEPPRPLTTSIVGFNRALQESTDAEEAPQGIA
jgi:hypothetical protein